jgi:hypothetical protein
MGALIAGPGNDGDRNDDEIGDDRWRYWRRRRHDQTTGPPTMHLRPRLRPNWPHPPSRTGGNKGAVIMSAAAEATRCRFAHSRGADQFDAWEACFAHGFESEPDAEAAAIGIARRGTASMRCARRRRDRTESAGKPICPDKRPLRKVRGPFMRSQGVALTTGASHIGTLGNPFFCRQRDRTKVFSAASRTAGDSDDFLVLCGRTEGQGPGACDLGIRRAARRQTSRTLATGAGGN